MFLINIGRILMLAVWGFLVFSPVHPFPKPLNIFMHIATFFMVVMHGLLMALYNAGQPQAKKLTAAGKVRVFLFGVFELLALLRRQQAELKNQDKS
ncbi:hypothetical protein CKG00_14705 (plasmid) [Morganella morganii]|uniref:DUF1145 family protein n=1 Tax=Morganella morganii TaxID=582 RepID=A0A433ZQP0_MORMO|nr:DUF1145 domain-containing protein [Morganella morganii]RUT64440.1 hypothetical protein CKG00_14705 [Morganella morganii]